MSNLTKGSKWKKYFRYYKICAVLFLIFIIINNVIISKKFDKNGIYTIGIIDSVKNKKHGLVLKNSYFISYLYKDRIYHSDIETGNYEYYQTGQRIFVKFVPDENGIGLGSFCTVPDSILKPPFEGWRQEWMKTHFPACYGVDSIAMDSIKKRFPNEFN